MGTTGLLGLRVLRSEQRKPVAGIGRPTSKPDLHGSAQVATVMKTLFSVLLVANVVSAIVAVRLASATDFADAAGYLQMSEGLALGRFSSHYALEKYYPETLRTMGYPIFILFCKSICNSNITIRVVQFALHIVSLFLSVRILARVSNGSGLAQLGFLFLTALNIQIPFYAGYIAAETTAVFSVTLFAYIVVCKKHDLFHALLLGLVGSVAFALRPSFLIFPFLLIPFSLFSGVREVKFFSAQLMFFAIGLMPFAVWNYQNHGVFKPTPIEGGAGVAHYGFWQHKLPVNYTEPFYWGGTMKSDYTNPFAFSASEREASLQLYEQEWKKILSESEILLSKEDKLNIEEMDKNPSVFRLYPSNFTLTREKLLWGSLMRSIRMEPWYYVKTRVYSFCRFYFTGIDHASLMQQASFSGKLKGIFPFAVTFICVFLGILASVVFFLHARGRVGFGYSFLLLLCLYQGLIHVPFAIQGRYTVPVHLLVLILFSVVIDRVFAALRRFTSGSNASSMDFP
jgi:hypothetical protein